ncbi:dual specificity mitogen-activated protein kinase kinase 4-like [Centruroides sculpturatus]|uniref:dual specificity mitogen-activated protein kinase kinase 4-like n=1 Tax=Centruroides sculpturatus TaxID=218467 RepID=UPI000C6E0F10|nr:dual specificity mitogen-activated protein kinase kinase 4-like [Centruroides sculpturatus]
MSLYLYTFVCFNIAEKRGHLKLTFNSTSSRKSQTTFPGCGYAVPIEKGLVPRSIQSSGKLKISPEVTYDFTADDLTDLGEIGRGAFGTVNKMVHKKSTTVMAVKRIRSTVDEKEQKQLLMDLEVVMKSNDCPFIVQFYGAIFKEGDCWICMELMDTSLDKFYKFIHERQKLRIPESILGKVTVAVSNAIIEVATGKFPYPKWNSVFEQLTQVVQGDPPQLSLQDNGNSFTLEFVNFVNTWYVYFNLRLIFSI